MARARNESPRELRGLDRGWARPTGRGLGTEIIKKIFELNMASFDAFWELILLQLNCLSYILYKCRMPGLTFNC